MSHRHSESGAAAGTVPVCRKWRALLSGCRWRVAARLNPSAAAATGRPPWGLRQGKSLSVGQAWRSREISSVVPVEASSGSRCHMTASTGHFEKGHARWGSVHLDGPLWARAPHAGCVEHPSDNVRRQDQHHSQGLHDDPLCRSAVAAPGVQGHFCLACLGYSVDCLLDVHAAARGLIQDPALRQPVAQRGACSRVSQRGQRPVIGARLGVLLEAPAFSCAVAPGACFAWGRGFRHCCVAVPKSRGWGADYPWLMYVLWARRGVGWGACTLAPRAGLRVCVWALGAPPAVCVVWVTPLRGASEAGRSPSSGSPPPGGCRGPLSTFCGRGCAGVGAQHCLLGLLALWGLQAAGVVGGRPRAGWPAAVVRSVWCQVLSLSRPPGFRDPCVPGAVGVGVGTAPLPQGVRPCGHLRRGAPVGGAFRRCEGRLGSGAPPLPPTCCGRGCAGVGAQHCLLGLHALWGLRAAWVVGAVPGGVACHRCEGRLASGAVPPPAARPLGRAAGVSRPVCRGCGWRGCGGPAPAPQRAPLRAGVVPCGAGGRASPAGVPSAVVRGV